MSETLCVSGKNYNFSPVQKYASLEELKKLPFSLKVLLENIVRLQNTDFSDSSHIDAILRRTKTEIPFSPARVLMQDFTGVPAVADLAAMRDAVKLAGKDPKIVNPLKPVDLVIDHSVMVDYTGTNDAFKKNVDLEYSRNKERYEFLKWAQGTFDNMRIVPPGTGICHQINMEYLAHVVYRSKSEELYMDTVVGTDSHTTMINGLGVLGWGVGGIEAEAVMLGRPIYMMIPEVVGFKMTGSLKEGVTSTDLVLTATQLLRKHGVVGKFVEFYGEGYKKLHLFHRATLANMAPEYGATCGYCPIDQETLAYLQLTNRSLDHVLWIEEYTKKQGLWYEEETSDDIFDSVVHLDLSSVEPSLSGPKRPQDRVSLSQVPASFQESFSSLPQKTREDFCDGAVVIASITSCTNTSNPFVLIAAGLVARKAKEFGLKPKPWVKTSFAPGSQVVEEYLKNSKLLNDLDYLGFNIAAYGCTTCIGNSGPLIPDVSAAVEKDGLSVAAVLSGNRNFEGRVHPQVKANYLASPPLVVVYALAGNVNIDLSKDPVAFTTYGLPVYLKDIWPTDDEIKDFVQEFVHHKDFEKRYKTVLDGDENWKNIKSEPSVTYSWNHESTYIKKPPYFEKIDQNRLDVKNIYGAKILALLGDSITTDHISPAGSIKKDGPAGSYLTKHGVETSDFNSYGARRGNHEVMVRGTFANIRLQNEMTPEIQGGFSKNFDTNKTASIYEISQEHQLEQTPLVVFAGKEYGTGSSRDWAAKGTLLLGVKAVIAESFERIHRSNLIGMGVLPLTFEKQDNRKTLKLKGDEIIDIMGLEEKLTPSQIFSVVVHYKNGDSIKLSVRSQLSTEEEIDQYKNKGVLLKVFRDMI